MEMRSGSTPPVSWLDLLSSCKLRMTPTRSYAVESLYTARFDAAAANGLYVERRERATRPTTVVRLVLGSGAAPGPRNMGSSARAAAW